VTSLSLDKSGGFANGKQGAFCPPQLMGRRPPPARSAARDNNLLAALEGFLAAKDSRPAKN
jgi:hypothetical protein